jgi:hypothetical protein
VAMVETDQGVLITPQEVLAASALDQIGEILRQQGLSLEDLMESSSAQRAAIAEEAYGSTPVRQDG